MYINFKHIHCLSLSLSVHRYLQRTSRKKNTHTNRTAGRRQQQFCSTRFTLDPVLFFPFPDSVCTRLFGMFGCAVWYWKTYIRGRNGTVGKLIGTHTHFFSSVYLCVLCASSLFFFFFSFFRIFVALNEPLDL